MLHSYVERKIDFQPEEGWVALNPSVVLHDGCLIAVIRTVNYRISEQGQYLIRGTDGTANATNPINTRNWLACFNDDMSLVTSGEIANPVGMPCEFPLVIGFEDMRLFSHGGHLYASAPARQFHIDGNCEQVLIRLGLNPMCVAEYKRMLREPRETQKNWMPIDQAPEIKFMYRLGEVVNSEGVTVANRPTKLATNQICGGTQLIRFVGGYLCLVHESNPRPDTGVRYYQHRFVWCDDAFDNYKISLPFMFEDKVIEYASGLCWHPDGKRLVISYGFKDCEARLATIDAMELSAELGAAGSHLW